MNDIISVIISFGGVFVIIIFGIRLYFHMRSNYDDLREQKNRIAELLERRNRRYHKNKDTKELEEEDDETSAVTPDTIRKYENKFDELSSEHSMYEQLISVLPMLGILGTVIGLIYLNMDEVDISVGLNTALWTTAAGLLGAIILKVFDTKYPSKTINDVAVMLDDFDRKLDLADRFEE